MPLIVLASNGEKWTFTLRTNKTNNDRNIYKTDFSFLINEANYQYTDENIDTIYDLFKNGNLTFKMDKKISREYIQKVHLRKNIQMLLFN